nr:BTB/POZ domain [Pandoravirus massiliensis]
MHKRLSIEQQHSGDAGAESEVILDMKTAHSTEVEPDYIVTFDVGGTTIRTHACTLFNHGCSADLARAIQEQRVKGLDADPIFVDCDPADFMLMLNFLRYGSSYIDATTLARIGHVRAHIGMTSAKPISSAAQGVSLSAPVPNMAPRPRLCDAEYARVLSEMEQLMSFILCVDHDKAQRAIERYNRLDALIYRRSADGLWHLGADDVSHARAEMDRLRDFIVGAQVCDAPADAKTSAWAKDRYRHLDALLAQTLSITPRAHSATTATTTTTCRAGGSALTTGQKNALFVGALFLVPVIISAFAGPRYR